MLHTHRKYLSTFEVQRELGLSAGHVEELIASRRLPAFRILGQWRIERELLERMIDDLYEESAGAVRGNTVTKTAAADAAATPRDVSARTSPEHPAIPAGLTDQQRRILLLVGQGMSNAEIAADLSVEISTVKSHVSRILQRCDLRDREQLIVLAWQSGLMSDDPRGRSPAIGG